MLSLNRGFSAPIKLTVERQRARICNSSRRATPIRSIAGRRCRSLANALLIGNVAAIRAGSDAAMTTRA